MINARREFPQTKEIRLPRHRSSVQEISPLIIDLVLEVTFVIFAAKISDNVHLYR